MYIEPQFGFLNPNPAVSINKNQNKEEIYYDFKNQRHH